MKCNHKFAMAAFGLAGVFLLDPLSAAMKPGEYLNGQWSTDSGNRGITFTYLPRPNGSGTLFGAVFGYDNAGEDTWLIVQGDFLEHQFTTSADVFAFEGGTFGNPPVDASANDIGDATFTLNSCGSVDVSFDFDGALSDLPDVTWELQRLGDEVGLPQGSQCVYEQEFQGCPDFAQTVSAERRECLLAGQFLNQDITLTNDITWVIKGTVEIGGDNTDSSTLTIEPGTVMVGSGVTDDFLWVSRGSEIFINGQPNAPVVLTSPFDGFEEGDIPLAGDIGGIAVAGNAQCNSADANGDCFSEFARADQILAYGGNDNADSSGSIRYAQIRYAGITVADNQEINTWTFLGVGNGTNVSHIQSYQGSDDGIEFFGGTVNVRHSVFTAGQDDSIDWDEGWSGKLQYGLIAYGNENGDHGFESANNPDNDDALPRAQPILSNITIIGVPGSGTGDGIRFKEGTAGQVWNSIIYGFDASCINLTDLPTYTAAGTPQNPTGITAFAGMIVDNCTQIFKQDADAPWNVEDFFNAFPNNDVTDPMLDGFQPMPGSPALSGGLRVVDLATQEPVEFFDNTQYRGAFDGKNDWTRGWTFDPLGLLIE